ncbi:MAG: type ISP restriction/modification enzyme, partial [Chloroflexota bacterium]|nr:type ISP restriction/modification enzyme [Chloroflexota bacterium]
LSARDRQLAFNETRDRHVTSECRALFGTEAAGKAVDKLLPDALAPRIERCAYRSFDRQWLFADNRLGDYLRPSLWRAQGKRQVFLSTSFQRSLDSGPALTCSAFVPDRNHFCNRGAKDTVPLYRTADAAEANVLPGLLRLLGEAYKRDVTPEDFLAYVYGALAQPAFTARFAKELETRELRVPITKDAALFQKVRHVGARLLWLHTYGERFVPQGKQRAYVPPGQARCTKAVAGDAEGYPEAFDYSEATRTLHVGEGEFAPVAPEVYEFEVSGLKVVQSWLRYRIKKGAGKKSSPLDDIRPGRWTSQFTSELLELLWVLEATVAGYPEQAKLLEAVLAGECFHAGELPPVPDYMRKPPKRPPASAGLFDATEDD